MRYIRAFFQALRLTLQGKTIEASPTPYPNLQDWLIETKQRLEEVYQTAQKAGFDKQSREDIALQLDGRLWSIELILESVKFHLETEFPSLMHSQIDHNLTTLYALHLDDKYRVSQLAQSDQLPDRLRASVQTLSQQLNAIPSSTDP